MLALALRARTHFGGSEIPIVYECLDIHRLLLRNDFVGRVMRGAERHLARDVRLLLTSSPAFVRHYFEARRQVNAPIEIIENRHFEPVSGSVAAGRPAGPPWRIGWFGALRCLRSLGLLADFSGRAAGRFEIVMRGRPALSEFPDFHNFVDRRRHLSFGGPYRNPEDIAAIYGDVHFAWLIDFFEDGLNSRWLLPNRLYEGCSFGAVPIALEGTETAAFLRARGIGVVLPDPSVEALDGLLGAMSPEEFASLRAAVLAHDRKNWVYDRQDCRDFVARLRSAVAHPHGLPMEMAA
jgi:succinoglycan biosynthesis protein ExoL